MFLKVLIICIFQCVFVASQEGLETALKQSYIATTNYVKPSSGQLDLATILFESLITTQNYTSNDVTAWASLGLSIRRTSQDGAQFAVISEPTPTAGKGHGFYAINLSSRPSFVRAEFLQAPHRPSDLHTYEIVYELFTSGKYLASAWSTTHRDNVDLCKEPMSYYNSYTAAVANAIAQSYLLQLHGFDKHSHNTSADIIFSSTKKGQLPPKFEPTFQCLKTSLGPSSSWKFNVFKYPDEIDVPLGGTLNINAQYFYEADPNGLFYHVETSRELRNELVVNYELRQLFSACFLIA